MCLALKAKCMTKNKLLFHVRLKDGRLVRVIYTPNMFGHSDHFEFNGYATSETGYRSHFLQGTIGDVRPEVAGLQIAEELAKEVKPASKEIFVWTKEKDKII